MKKAIALLLLIAASAAGAAVYLRPSVPAAPGDCYRTASVQRGELLSTISSTGTVEPEEVVDVGAQVIGLIKEFGRDPRDPTKTIDYNSAVEEGTVLARIDPTPYEASLEQAEATLERSEAELVQLQAKCEQAEEERKRAEQLRNVTIRGISDRQEPIKAISDSDYDLIATNWKTAKASVAVGKATIRQNKAAVKVAKTNLGYTTITSPVRGVIIDRRVNIGQTVVASLNAPSLFLIAKDLRRVQVWASVNEADIGRIRVGMPARFTVDACQGQSFRGGVTQIRMNAAMTQNVVTYTVVVTTDNSSGKLMPYLTANVLFEVDRRSGVLLAPNAALRWTPQPSQIDPEVGAAAAPAAASAEEGRGRVWLVGSGGFVRPLDVAVGASDGTMTEISGSGVEEGMQVVVGEQGDEEQEGQETSGGEKAGSPFLPKPPKGAKPPPGPPM